MDVSLGGKTRTLRFSVIGMASMEVRSEKHLGWYLGEMGQGRYSVAVCLWMLWAGLQHEQAPPTVAEVAGWIQAHIDAGHPLVDFSVPIGAAMAVFLPERKPPDGDEGNVKPEAGSPSPTSGSQAG